MKLERTYQEMRRNLLARSVDHDLLPLLRDDPQLRDLADVPALLELLETYGEQDLLRRDAAIRGLLRAYRLRSSAAGAALFVAYFPRIRALCREFHDGLRRHDLEERRAVVVAAFFEAAARTPCEERGAPTTGLSLALKARQCALRAICRSALTRRHEVTGFDSLPNAAARTVTPESVLLYRETAGILEQVLSSGKRLANVTSSTEHQAALLLDSGNEPLRERARALHPHASESEVTRLHQRLRQQRSRVLRGARQISRRKLSQIRGYLDLWEQEGWQ